MGKYLTPTGVSGIYRTAVGSLVIDKVVDGRRIYRNYRDRGGLAMDRAKRDLRAAEGRLALGLVGDAAPPRASSLTVLDILNQYWAEHLSRMEYGRRVGVYLMSALADRLGSVAVSDEPAQNGLKKFVVEGYIRDRQQDHVRRRSRRVSARTVQAEMQLLNAAVNHAVDMERLRMNTIKRFVGVSVPHPARIVIDDGLDWGAQWQAVYGALWTASARKVALGLYLTGMRPQELYMMRYSWFSEAAPGFWVIDVPREAEKTKAVRRIPVDSRLLNSCPGPYGQSEDFFAPTDSGEPYSRWGIRRAWSRAVSAAGMDPRIYTPYCLRRTRITIWDGVDEGAARFATGHRPKDSHSRNYVRITDSRLARLVGIEYRPALAVAV